MTLLDDRPATAAELIGVFEVGSPRWHAARENGVGGSEIAALLNMSKWESHFSLWHRKKKHLPPQEQNTEMDAGRRLEPVICDVFAERHPEFIVRKAGTYRNRERPEQIANPDRLLFPADHAGSEGGDALYPSELLEAKFALFPDGWGEEGTDDVPVYYTAQTRWYLDVFGLSKCRLMVFIGSTGEFREYVVEADPVDAALMRERAADFMASLRENRKPPIDGHDRTYWAIKQLPDGVDDTGVEIDVLLAGRYLDAVDAAKAAKTEKQECAALILDALGNRVRAGSLGELVATRAVKADGTTHSLRPATPGKEFRK